MIQDFMPGYPIDLRPPERRRQAAEGPTYDFEGNAARVVARLTGERVVIQDDGSKPSMPDIRIDYADKPAAYIEVVVDIDPSYAAMEAEIWKRAVPIPAARRWQVRVSGRPKLTKLRPQLSEILGSLHTPPGPQEVQRLYGLGVTDIAGPWMPRPGESGAIQLLPDGISGTATPTWEPFLDWIATFLASNRTADVREKLAATGAAERHAFVGASFTTPAPAYFALREEGRPELPDRDPSLPAQVTHLWVWSVPGIERCLVWFPGIGWFDPMDRWATP